MAEQRAIITDLSDLDSEIRQVAKTWSGLAQEVFLASIQRWDADMRELNASLADAATAVKNAAEGYRHADEQVGEIWSL